MEAVFRLLDNAMKIDAQKAWFFAIDREVQEEIVLMNTEEQLWSKGIDSEGRSLGDYAPSTVAYKRSVGDRYDHITLRDAGAFYDSFKVVVTREGFEIWADDESLYDEPLTDVYGLDVLGLTNENLAFLTEFIQDNVLNYLQNELLK